MPTFDNSVTKLDFGVDTITTAAFTIGSGDDLYGAACLSTLGDPGAITVATMGGVAGEAVPDASGADASWNHTVYKFPSPPSGDQTVTFTWTNARSAVVSALTVTGASDVDGGVYAQAASGTVSVDIASNDGDLTASFSGDGNTGTDHATNQTIRISGALIGADTGPGSAGPITHTWTHAGAFASNAVGINFVAAVVLATVPDVVGQTQAEATSAIEAEGLVVAVETAHNASVALGLVISQDPAAATEVAPSSTVTITVSLGPEPTPQETASGGFHFHFDAYSRQRLREREEFERLERESESIEDDTSREIAKFLREQEAKDLERTELERLQSLADRFVGKPLGLPARTRAALYNASEMRTRNALEQMRREIERMYEEEEAMVIAILNDDA